MIIDRLKKYMLEKNKTPHDITMATGFRTPTVIRWITKDVVPNFASASLLNTYLTNEGY